MARATRFPFLRRRGADRADRHVDRGGHAADLRHRPPRPPSDRRRSAACWTSSARDGRCRVLLLHHPPVATMTDYRRRLVDGDDLGARARTHGRSSWSCAATSTSSSSAPCSRTAPLDPGGGRALGLAARRRPPSRGRLHHLRPDPRRREAGRSTSSCGGSTWPRARFASVFKRRLQTGDGLGRRSAWRPRASLGRPRSANACARWPAPGRACRSTAGISWRRSRDR